MSNTHYTKTFDVSPGSKITSQAIEDQFLLVEQGFDSVDTDVAAFLATRDAAIALRSLKAGDTYTGTHNFTGATSVLFSNTAEAPTQPQTDSTTKLATTKYVRDAMAAATAVANVYSSVAAYGVGATAYSPLNFATYRNTTGVNAGIDPSIDTTNWASIAGSAVGNNIFLFQNFGGL